MPHTLDPLLGLRRVAEDFEDGMVPRLEAVHLEKLLFHVRLDVQVHRHRVENRLRGHALAVFVTGSLGSNWRNRLTGSEIENGLTLTSLT